MILVQKRFCFCKGFWIDVKKRHCPKCAAKPISVTPIWKWKIENKEHPIRGLYMTFFEKFLFKFPFSHKRFQMGQKMYFHQLYKLQWKSLTNPISVCKWKIAPFPLQSILGNKASNSKSIKIVALHGQTNLNEKSFSKKNTF